MKIWLALMLHVGVTNLLFMRGKLLGLLSCVQDVNSSLILVHDNLLIVIIKYGGDNDRLTCLFNDLLRSGSQSDAVTLF